MNHRVLIVARHTLFARAMEALLAKRPTVRVVATIDSTRELLDAIATHRPDTVIMERDADDTLSLCSEFETPRLIAVTMESSTIDIFDITHVSRAGAADLLAAVDGSVQPDQVAFS